MVCNSEADGAFMTAIYECFPTDRGQIPIDGEADMENGVHAHRRLFLDKRQHHDVLGDLRYVGQPMTIAHYVYYTPYTVLQEWRLIEG